ncbi:MAG: N-formylglutamate amidohydrolase [Planctomycetaceae bacterium]
MKTFPGLLAAICIQFLAVTPGLAGEDQAGELVTIESGDLPIILSAPHGGREIVPDVPVRVGRDVNQFKVLTDTRTAELTEKLADEIEQRLGKRPYVVIARFHRKYIDANRPPQDAYESPAAKEVYDAYHTALARARHEVIERWGRGVLFDVHGQVSVPDSILRGTRNGKTTTHLVDRFGREALIGETSLFGQIASRGIPVVPAVGSTNLEPKGYNGGYIVGTYGSAQGGALDAIQLEVGQDLRKATAIPQTAVHLADSICGFAKEYLPQAEQRRAALRPDPGS